MKILALELSTTRGSLAWLQGGGEEAREWPNDRQNSSMFFENTQCIVKKFGAPFDVKKRSSPSDQSSF